MMLVVLFLKTADAFYFAIVQTTILSWLNNDQMVVSNQLDCFRVLGIIVNTV